MIARKLMTLLTALLVCCIVQVPVTNALSSIQGYEIDGTYGKDCQIISGSVTGKKSLIFYFVRLTPSYRKSCLIIFFFLSS